MLRTPSAAARSGIAADSLAATAATARLMESPPSGSQQEDCSAAGADQTAHREIAAAVQFVSSLAANATARLKESPSAMTQQEDCSADCSADINFGSIIGFLLSRFKSPLYGFRIAGLKLGMASIPF